MNLDTVWHGSLWREAVRPIAIARIERLADYADECPPRPTARPLRLQLLALLEQQPIWKVRDLQRASGRDRFAVNAAVYTLKRQRQIFGRGYGKVSLTRGPRSPR